MGRYPALSYFALTFAISWGGVLVVVGPGGLPGTAEQIETLLPFAIIAMLAGPSVAGLLLTGVVDGTPGLHRFLARLLRWRVAPRWYAAALLTAPIVMLAVLLVLSQFSPEFSPGLLTADDKASLLLFGVTVAVVAGFFEELGWTGFATRRLRRHHSVVATGLIVGLLWATWHVLVGFWASGASPGALSLASFLLDPFLFLAGFRVLIVWVYDRTRSLLLAMLMHASLTASARVLSPFGAGTTASKALLTFDLAWAAAVGIIVTVVITSRQRDDHRRIRSQAR